MPIEKVFAHISCSNLQSSIAWFTKLFGRAPDESPMEGLAEWHQNNQAGFQLFQDPKNAGHATMSATSIPSVRVSLSSSSQPGPIEEADYVNIVRIRDPDQNLIVLAAKRK
jgi:hypothetical protein